MTDRQMPLWPRLSGLRCSVDDCRGYAVASIRVLGKASQPCQEHYEEARAWVVEGADPTTVQERRIDG